jgi:anti-sigma factor RsiW
MTTCKDLIAFADGELPRDRAQAFRKHLSECRACQEGLMKAMQLSARLSDLLKGS